MGAEMIAKPKSIKRIIVQKYIENPLLYNRRKFDIRIWVLVNQEKKVYFYMDGYARTSSLEFNLQSEDLNNLIIHLTNNAIQKYSNKYNSYENANMLSLN